MLHRAPDGDPVAVRGRDERVRLDGELGDHRKGIDALDDDVGRALGGLHVPPAVAVLAQDVGVRECVVRAERWVLDERCTGRQSGVDRSDGGECLEVDTDKGCGRFREIERLRRDGGYRLAVIDDLSIGDDGPIAKLGPEARHGLWQVHRREHHPDAVERQRGSWIDRADPSARRVDGDELDAQRVLESDVGDVHLATGHTVQASDAHRWATDPVAAHLGTPSAASSTASMICWYPAQRQ